VAFGGSSTSVTLPHTHNQTLAADGGQLSQTLTDMGGVVLYSEITDNSAAVAANTAAIAAIAGVPSGLVTYWAGGANPSGWVDAAIEGSLSNTTQTGGQPVGASPNDRSIIGQQWNTGNDVVGNNPNKMTWYLYKEGSPTGTVYARITNSTGTAIETSTTTLDPSTLGSDSASATAVEFTFTGNTTITNGDMLTIEYNAGDTSNRIFVRANETAALSNSVYRMYRNSLAIWQTISATESATCIVNWGDFNSSSYIEKS